MKIHLLILWSLLSQQILGQNNTQVSDSLIENLSANNYEAACNFFDSNLKSKLNAQQLGQIWNSIILQYGRFSKISDNHSSLVQDSIIRVESTCIFEKGELIIQTALNRNSNKIIGLFFRPSNSKKYSPPTYVKSDLITEKQIKLRRDSFFIKGTLTWPKNKSTSTLIILVPGSGPVDRDETIGPNKPFKDIALGLATSGIASFRFDKSTFTIKSFKPKNFQEEYSNDLHFIVNYFAGKDSINGIVLLGHSLGSSASLFEANRNKKIKGLILMAGNARPVEDLIIEQCDYLLSHSASTSGDSSILKSLRNSAITVKLKQYNESTDPNDLPLKMNGTYWKSLQSLNPISLSKKIKAPILILQGERDYQVPMKDFELWQKFIGGRKNVTLKSYKDLNHLFFEGVGLSTPKEYLESKNIPDYVIMDLVKWLRSF